MTKDDTVLWNVTPCRSVERQRRFGGPYCFHLQGRRVSQGRNQREGDKQSFITLCVMYSEDGGRFPRNDGTCVLNYMASHQTGLAITVYTGIRFKSRPDIGIPQTIQANAMLISRVGHFRFLPDPFQFISHQVIIKSNVMLSQ